MYQPFVVLNWAPAIPIILVDLKLGEWFAGIAGKARVDGQPWPFLEPLFFFDQAYLYYDSRKTYTYMGQNRYALEGYRRDMQPTQLAQRTLQKQKITRRPLVPTVLAELAVRCQTPTPKPKPTVEPDDRKQHPTTRKNAFSP